MAGIAMSDSILVLRCPYCTTGDDFKQLRAYKDGRFVCDECSHTVRPRRAGLSLYVPELPQVEATRPKRTTSPRF
jgi:hypothetical protein